MEKCCPVIINHVQEPGIALDSISTELPGLRELNGPVRLIVQILWVSGICEKMPTFQQQSCKLHDNRYPEYPEVWGKQPNHDENRRNNKYEEEDRLDYISNNQRRLAVKESPGVE
jgi:hypothetical protein